MDDIFIRGFLDKVLSGNTEESVESIISMTKLLNREHLDNSNSFFFLKVIDLNLIEASDIIFSNRNPETFFSPIIPFYELLNSCMMMLTGHRPSNFYLKNILSCFGILQMTYKNPKYGFNVFRLSINDLQHIGKYLILNDKRLNDIIIDVLSDIWKLNSVNFRDISVKAKEITDCFFDNNKKLSDVIPEVILV